MMALPRQRKFGRKCLRCLQLIRLIVCSRVDRAGVISASFTLAEGTGLERNVQLMLIPWSNVEVIRFGTDVIRVEE